MAIPSKVETSFFCIPLPGKPDPNQQWDPASKEARPRVTQKEQKGETCGYYALQILRNEKRIGKYPLESQMEARKIEQMISSHRKEISKIDETLQPQIVFATEITNAMKPTSGHFTRVLAEEFLKNSIHLLEPIHLDRCKSHLESFCKQQIHNDLSTYANDCYNQAEIPLMDQFFKTFNISDQKIQDSIPKTMKKSWQELTTFEKNWHRRNMVFMTSIKLYDCKPSPWHPEQPLKSLVEQLKNHGPHVLTGKFGQMYYKEHPFQLDQKIEGRPLFGWKPDSKRKELLDHHLIVIVGAKIDKEKQHVYFLDPLDSSDPKDITTQKIYVMSFDRLKLSIADLSGIQRRTLDGEVVFDPMEKGINNYALHM